MTRKWYRVRYGWQDTRSVLHRRALIQPLNQAFFVWLKPSPGGTNGGWKYNGKRFETRNEVFDFAEDYLSNLP